MLTEMPRRMQAMEDRVQTLECRVQLLNDSTLSPQPQPDASSNALKAPPSVSDKPSDEAVRECREAVGVMLSMQQNMKQELAAIEEQMCMRSNDFEASLRAAANANHDAVHALFASYSQEVEALYARSAACEEGLQDLQTQSSLLAEWKDGASSDLAEYARRLVEVERAARAAEFTEKISAGGTTAASRAASKTAAAGLDEGLRASVVPEDAGQLIQATRATSKIAVAQGVASDEVLPTSTVSEDAGQVIQAARATSKIAVAQSVASDEAVRNVQEVAIKALDVAQKALLIAEETRAQGSKTCKDGDKLAPQKAAGTWPCRPRVLQGCLPYLPPSSLAHEMHRPKQRSPGCRKDRMNGSWHDRSPSSSATDDSDLKDDTELGPLPQTAELREAKTPALVLLAASGGGSTARGRTQQEEEKERFLPPTGGCFRHLSPHSRLGSRNTRPLTAERPPVVHRGGVVRPSTAGHLFESIARSVRSDSASRAQCSPRQCCSLGEFIACMASLYPSLRSPLLPGPQSPGTQAAQTLKDGVQRRLLSCQLEDLISAGTDTRSTPKPLVTELAKSQEPVPPGLLRTSIDGQRGRPTERIMRDIEERKASLRKVAKHSWNPATDLEPSLEERPLLLLGDFMPKDGLKEEPETGNRERKILLWDEGRRCFASHWPGALASSFCSYAFDLLLRHGPWEALHSKKGQVTRETCWYVRAGCRCDYTYGIARVRARKKPSATFRAAMETLLEEVMGRVCPWLPKDAWPNCANLNLYTEAWQSVGWHADDESLFMGRDRDCPILSVSLGARREFWLALRHENCMDPQLKSIVEVDLCDGDVLTMEGLCQKHCVHFVPCDVRNVAPHPRESKGARINVTWRWIRDHKQRCPRRAADGDSTTDFFFEKQGQVPSEKKALFAHSWAGGRAMAWRSCQECDHDAWKGGRNCLKHQKQWLCRPCYEYVLTGGPPRERLQPPRPRGQRRPDISMIRARAVQAEAVEADEDTASEATPDPADANRPASSEHFCMQTMKAHMCILQHQLQLQQHQALLALAAAGNRQWPWSIEAPGAADGQPSGQRSSPVSYYPAARRVYSEHCASVLEKQADEPLSESRVFECCVLSPSCTFVWWHADV
ncbi:ALKBH3 [Symbiodinium sp. CCMP2592]|nr:ALKBH3 [Symbiodinium sp. CCMP2592]